MFIQFYPCSAPVRKTLLYFAPLTSSTIQHYMASTQSSQEEEVGEEEEGGGGLPHFSLYYYKE
jgi:hypothetical protein